MTLTTVVTLTVRGDKALAEARSALRSLADSPVGPVELSESPADDADASTSMVLSLSGDVRAQVEEHLAAVPVVAYESKVVPHA